MSQAGCAHEFGIAELGKGTVGRCRWVAKESYLLLGDMETRGLKQP